MAQKCGVQNLRSKVEPRALSRAELLAEYPDVACRLMGMAILDNHPELVSRLGDKALNRMLKGDHGVLPDLMLTDPGAFQEHPLKRLAGLAVELAASIPSAVNLTDWMFSPRTANECTIEGYNGPGGDLVIPSTLYGKSVTSIGEAAFLRCVDLVSVIIPSDVTDIETNAFSGCSALARVVMLGDVTRIGEFAFYDCKALESVNIPDAVTNIGDFAFAGCCNLKSVTGADGILVIGEQAFFGSALTDVDIPEGVTQIGDDAFAFSALKRVSIPSSVISLGHGVFNCCPLRNVIIPRRFSGHLEDIGIDADRVDITFED